MPFITPSTEYSLLFCVLLCTFFLLTKHLIFDWYLQTDEMIKRKGVLFDLVGASHSALHGVGTFISVILFVKCFNDAIFIAVADFIIHYVIDFIKMNFGCQDMRSKKFWNHIGLDQYLHQITYLGFVYYIFV